MPPRPTPSTRVLKKLKPGDPGSRRLLERFGDKLICVRYRETSDGSKRLTTVELLISERKSPKLKTPPTQTPLFGVHAGQIGSSLHNQLEKLGATWNPEEHTWKTPWPLIVKLGITNRVVSYPPHANAPRQKHRDKP